MLSEAFENNFVSLFSGLSAMCKMEKRTPTKSNSKPATFLDKFTLKSPTSGASSSPSDSPTNEWLSNTQEAIQLLERRLDGQQRALDNKSVAYEPRHFDQESDRPQYLQFGYRHKSEGEINDGSPNSSITPLKSCTSSTLANGVPKNPSTTTSTCSTSTKPSILKTSSSSSSKHKRCASLGQTIRYIDEPSPSPFTPWTCPSTPNAFNFSSPTSCNCSYCNCRTSPRSVPLLTPSDESQSQDQSWFPQNGANPHCTFCGCAYQQMKSVSLDSDLMPPMASVEQLSVLDSHGYLEPSVFNPSESIDRNSIYSIHMERDARYYLQHPYARLALAYLVIFCNFLIFAEDPISHSHEESSIPIIGNVISFICTKYPTDWPWVTVKVSLWVSAIFVGLIVGKYIVHHILLRRILRLKMFRDEEGTWMIMYLSVLVSCYIFSVIYNFLLVSAHPAAHRYVINTRMGVTNANFMKAAACGTWLGDFFTAWMVTDMMLQDNLYPGWAKGLRSFWQRHGLVRIFIFWSGTVGMSAIVIYLIVSDDISWDNLNKDFVTSSELSRAFLASSILVMDLLIVMQDWDFPHFVCDLDIKLPGLYQASYTLELFRKSLTFPEMFFHISGKWFNYGIILVVMMLDLNMWKNQIIYYPPDYGQYTGPDNKVYTVADKTLLYTGNSSLWSYAIRASTIDAATNRTYSEGDLKVNSRFLGYPAYVKSMAFLPCAAGFILFFTLIYQYGRFPPKTDVSAGGRLRKRHSRSSSWRRERRDSRLGGYISWRGITEYRIGSVLNRGHVIKRNESENVNSDL